ncbi:MAG: hypothetical protein COB38_01160 [Gammaproteobacteria bacterium]|nr:MAG: hypothetical protein COB38_01160 [Gammaproteobacteria bacterium]
MGSITLGGLGSGLDVGAIVEALVNAERAPKQNSLDRLETDVTVTLTGLGGLGAALDELRSSALDLSLSSSFSKRSVSISNDEFFTASATSSASSGDYDIEVTALAQASQDQTSIFTGGSETTFGVGTLTFTVGTESFDIEVSATDTLEDIRNNINESTDNDLVAVNLLNNISDGTDTGSILDFNSLTTGLGNDLVVTFTGDASLADLSDTLTQTQAASDATIQVDGFTATSSTNSFDDIIPGITIDVVKVNENPGDTNQLEIDLDTSSTQSLISGFVQAFNAFADVTSSLGSTATGAKGLLLGDFTLRQVSSQLRSLLSTPVTEVIGNSNSLSSIGITTTQDGHLEIDSDILSAAIKNNFEEFETLFASDNGFATKLRNLVDGYTNSTTGIISSRKKSLTNQLSNIDDQRLSLNRKIDALHLRLTKQFATMDALVAQFNSTGSFIAQQFENLPGFGGKK